MHFFRVFLFLSALLFLHRPMLLAGEYRVSLLFFSGGMLGLLAAGLMLFEWDRLLGLLKELSFPLRIALLLLTLTALYFDVFRCPGSCSGETLCLILIPLFAAVYRPELERVLPYFMTLLWIWGQAVMTGMLFFHRDHCPYGICGNWNWSMILLLTGVPFVCGLVREHLSACRRPVLKWVCTLLPLLPVLGIFPFSRSRAAIPVLAIGLFAALFLFAGKKYRSRLLTGSLSAVLLAVVLLLSFRSESVSGFLAGEIRLPLLEAGVKLVQQHPFGVGADAYESVLTPLRSMAYYGNPLSAVRSVHPHNELVYLAGVLGLPAFAALLFLFFAGLHCFLKRWDDGAFRTERKLFYARCFCSWSALLAYSMIDLPFHAWPLNVLVLLWSGLVLIPERASAPEKTGMPGRKLALLAGWSIVLCTCLDALFCGYASFRLERALHFYRSGEPGRAVVHALAGVPLLTQHPDLIYPVLLAASSAGQDELVLKLSSEMERTPHRDFARIHALRAQAFARLKRDREAIGEYEKDLERYPHLVLPLLGILNAYGRLGETEKIPAVRARLNEQMRRRNLTEADLFRIMRYPNWDLRWNEQPDPRYYTPDGRRRP